MINVLAPSIPTGIHPLPTSLRPAKKFLAHKLRQSPHYEVFLVSCGSTFASGFMEDKADIAAEDAFKRYTSNKLVRKGKGVAIVWFRNDLRLLDNEALCKAWVASEALLPVFCFDPRQFGTTYHFGFPKTGGGEGGGIGRLVLIDMLRYVWSAPMGRAGMVKKLMISMESRT